MNILQELKKAISESADASKQTVETCTMAISLVEVVCCTGNIRGVKQRKKAESAGETTLQTHDNILLTCGQYCTGKNRGVKTEGRTRRAGI